MAGTISVLVPTGKPRIKEIPVTPRVPDLNGKVIGFLWNGKPNADILLERIKEQLSQRFRLAGTYWHSCHSSEEAAFPDVTQEMVSNSDLVVVAIGDWGGCTTWSVHAALELEKRGKPTVDIVTTRFEFLARSVAASMNMKNLPLTIVTHPVGGLKREEVRAKAAQILEDVIARLTGAKS